MMEGTDRSAGDRTTVATPAMRAAVRSQIVGQGKTSSLSIAAALDLPHATVVGILERFAAVGGLRLVPATAGAGGIEVDPGSLTGRFRDLSLPLW